ncbi:MAG TPA: SARP family transcriptional regulator, partial [Pseudonocardiaceae bacterium]
MASEETTSGNTENQHAGPVHGPMVQASHIEGGVHVHNTAPDRILPQQLPGVTWHFTGRATELAELTSLLDNAEGRAGTVVISPSEPIGGLGTTALATRWAAEFASRFPDGALYVNLHGSDELAGPPIAPDQVIRGFLYAFGVPAPEGLDARLGTYRSVLAGRRVLLLLDDARDAEQVRPLLPGNSASWAVVTSRRPLPDLVATAGARPVTVSPLPDDDARTLLGRHVGDARLTNEPDAVA